MQPPHLLTNRLAPGTPGRLRSSRYPHPEPSPPGHRQPRGAGPFGGDWHTVSAQKCLSTQAISASMHFFVIILITEREFIPLHGTKMSIYSAKPDPSLLVPHTQRPLLCPLSSGPSEKFCIFTDMYVLYY